MTATSGLKLVVSVASLALSLAACTENPSYTTEANAASVGAPVVTTPVASEADRVKAFLDARYLKTDVRHSFHTKFQESIDCVDFFKQPGVKALAAAGTPLTAAPPAQPRPATLPDFAFDGAPDDEGNARSCPDGTVPLLRITAEHIAKRGGIDAFLSAHKKAGGPPSSSSPAIPAPTLMDTSTYAWVTSSYTGGANLSGGLANFTVWSPSAGYIDAGNHSIGQIWLAGSGSNGQETVEAGWGVDPLLNGDNNPHFFVFSTKDGYATGCYNVTPGCTPLFVVQSGAWMTPGILLSSGTSGSQHSFIQIETYNGVQGGVNGWLINGAGFYASSQYTGSFQTIATSFQAGGEVRDITKSWVFPMGSGSVPWAGDTKAAAVSDLNVLPTGAPFPGWTTVSFSTPTATKADYGFQSSNGPINGFPWSGFYIGDMPKVWWGQNYGFDYTPVGDWAPGTYKGQCGLGQPLIAISNTSNHSNAHALLCNESALSVTGSSCNPRLLSGADNRGYTDGGWDWDPGSVKAECRSNEYVQGVAQSGSGSFQGLLCCPSSGVQHTSCQTQTFYTSDSPGESGLPDWDPGDLKGHCPASWFVEGVSQGASGGVHSVLCCH